MNLKPIIIALAAVVTGATAMAEVATGNWMVVPRPQSITPQQGEFNLTPDTRVLYPQGNDDMARNANFLAGYINDNLGFAPTVEAFTANAKELKKVLKAGNVVVLGINSAVENPEGYKLTASPSSILIEGSSPQGVFYGVQTLRKALPVMPVGTMAQEGVNLPAAVVDDAPRFGYRGMLLDTGRHFLPVSAIEQFIDLLALHNMNTFHWHISDDQGWRLPVNGHPELTEIGSVRQQTIHGRVAGVYDGKPHGGYYTHDDIRHIIKYAADRHINIIPEVDLPGHTMSLLASHPELGCTGGPYVVAPHWGVFPDILCAGKEETFELVEDILDQVCELFPSEYIHIGGDEAPKVRWEQCPDCQRRIAEEGITAENGVNAEHRLQGYFTRRLEKYLNDKGRKIIGWEEILDSGVNPSTTIMAWHGFDFIVNSANNGHDVIGASNTYNYLDYYQKNNTGAEPFLIGNYLPLTRCYSYDPVDERILPENRHHVIGVQACVWGEFIGDANLMTYQMLPRMAAVCETQWINPDHKVFGQFLSRLERLNSIYDRYGYPRCRGYE